MSCSQPDSDRRASSQALGNAETGEHQMPSQGKKKKDEEGKQEWREGEEDSIKRGGRGRRWKGGTIYTFPNCGFIVELLLKLQFVGACIGLPATSSSPLV